MRRDVRFAALAVFLLWATTLACVVPGVPGLGDSEPAPTPTPLGDTLTYLIPAYAQKLDPGETVPGTRLTYLGRNGDAYDVSIDGLQATKRSGDSFIWSGVLAPGVYANFRLRLTTSILGGLPVAGPVEVIVFNPSPRELVTADDRPAQLHFGNVGVNYDIPAGRAVPGTTLVFEGISEIGQGQQVARLARFSGLQGYPYLAQGDSLVWTGLIRDNVRVHYSLRALAVSDESVRLAGIADLWLLRSG